MNTQAVTQSATAMCDSSSVAAKALHKFESVIENKSQDRAQLWPCSACGAQGPGVWSTQDRTGRVEHTGQGPGVWSTQDRDRACGAHRTRTGRVEHTGQGPGVWSTQDRDRACGTHRIGTGRVEHTGAVRVEYTRYVWSTLGACGAHESGSCVAPKVRVGHTSGCRAMHSGA